MLCVYVVCVCCHQMGCGWFLSVFNEVTDEDDTRDGRINTKVSYIPHSDIDYLLK